MKNKLSVERTNLAVDRTILAYLRTSLTIVVVAISFIKLFDGPFLSVLGWILIIFSLALLLYGALKCKRIKNACKVVSEQ